jgi:hypothetical protein
MFSRFIRKQIPLALLPALVVLGLAAPAHAQGETLFQGNAYGTYSFVGDPPVVRTEKTAQSSLGCTTTAGARDDAHVILVNLPPDVVTGSITTAVEAIDDVDKTATHSRALIEDLVIAPGVLPPDLITAASVDVNSETRMLKPGGEIEIEGSTDLVDLEILGIPVNLPSPAPNTEIDIPLVGRMVLNEQVGRAFGVKPFLTVIGIHVYVELDNLLGLPLGTEIIIGRAHSSLQPNVPGTVAGIAYGLKLNVAPPALDVGPIAEVGVGCLGTNGVLKENGVALIDLGALAMSGTVHSTGTGLVTATEASVAMTASVEDANLLGGLITADAITSATSASKVGGVSTFSDEGTTFLNLMVLGVPIDDDVEPNTRINLAGIGHVILRRTIQRPISLEVRMIEVVINNVGNPFGLAVGSRLLVAVTRSTVR